MVDEHTYAFGFFFFFFKDMVCKKLGEKVWLQIEQKAKVVSLSNIEDNENFDDNVLYNIVQAASKVSVSSLVSIPRHVQGVSIKPPFCTPGAECKRRRDSGSSRLLVCCVCQGNSK